MSYSVHSVIHRRCLSSAALRPVATVAAACAAAVTAAVGSVNHNLLWKTILSFMSPLRTWRLS